LGVHEHWNNPVDRQYSRNLGTGQGIELVALSAARPDPILSVARAGTQVVLSWQASLGYHLQTATNLALPGAWADASPPSFLQGRNVVTNNTTDAARFFRLKQ
jgi:hypothetical protein